MASGPESARHLDFTPHQNTDPHPLFEQEALAISEGLELKRISELGARYSERQDYLNFSDARTILDYFEGHIREYSKGSSHHKQTPVGLNSKVVPAMLCTIALGIIRRQEDEANGMRIINGRVKRAKSALRRLETGKEVPEEAKRRTAGTVKMISRCYGSVSAIMMNRAKKFAENRLGIE